MKITIQELDRLIGGSFYGGFFMGAAYGAMFFLHGPMVWIVLALFCLGLLRLTGAALIENKVKR